MPKTWPYLLAFVLVVNLALAAGPWTERAYACSCAGTSSSEEALQSSDAVFSGKVLEVGKLPPEPPGSTTMPMPFLNPVTFDVGEAWKGVSGSSVIVHGEGPEPSCGIDFDRGETYLVFAHHTREARDSPLQTDFCGATEQVDAEVARQMIGPPPATLPETGGISSERTERWSDETYAVAATIALATLAAGVFFARRAARGRTL